VNSRNLKEICLRYLYWNRCVRTKYKVNLDY